MHLTFNQLSLYIYIHLKDQHALKASHKFELFNPKAVITTAADDTLKYFVIFISENKA